MESEKIVEIYDILYTPFWLRSLFIIAIGVLVLFLLAVGAVLVRRYYTKKRVISYRERAKLKLEKLQLCLGDSSYDPVVFYVSLTALVKEFFSGHFDHTIIGFSDHECSDWLFVKKEIPFVYTKGLQSLFERAQLVKFAQHNKLKISMEEDLAICMKLIEELSADDESSK